jgi:hypothetical protein
MNYRLMDGRRWMGWSERGRRWCCGGGGRGWWRWVGVVWMFREVRGGNGVSGCLCGRDGEMRGNGGSVT